MTSHSTINSDSRAPLRLAAVALVMALSLLAASVTGMALPPVASWLATEQAAWYLNRGSGVVAYFMMAASVIWGLLLSTRLVNRRVPAPISLAMHNTLSWSSILLAAFHAAILLLDSYYTYTILHLLLPFTGPYAPIWVGLGTLAFWISLITAASFRWRKQIGQKNWRKLHYLTFLAYIFVTLHGWMAGSDALQLMPLYVGSVTLVTFLTAYRIVDAVAKRG